MSTEINRISQIGQRSHLLSHRVLPDFGVSPTRLLTGLIRFSRTAFLFQRIHQASYFHLKNIRSLKPYLSREALLKVTNSFITALIDYCNGLLYGITEHNINRLHRIQNCAARLITNTKKYDHITPVLYTLHWLPIRQRVQYKILLLTDKAIKGLAPAYICELISLKTSSRTLRSSDQLTLNTPVARLKSYVDSSLNVAGPRMWNKLHVGIKHAKTKKLFLKLF